MAKLVQGVGINDSDYKVQPRLNGKVVFCPFYRAWLNMINRCYCPKSVARNPTYLGCSVISEWLTFSCFRGWMIKQDWLGKHLDKDLLIPGNKLYSPETCVFIPASINKFLTDRPLHRGEWPLGVYLEHRTNKFRAGCKNPFTKKNVKLGRFTSAEHAHKAWRQHKHELACQLAEQQSDTRVAEALRKRYLLQDNH
jgi:hypothetical protein